MECVFENMQLFVIQARNIEIVFRNPNVGQRFLLKKKEKRERVSGYCEKRFISKYKLLIAFLL